MIDVKQLVEEYSKSMRIRQEGDVIFLTPPFFHIESDESIALKFSKTEDGLPVISDCGTTVDYLELRDIDIERYRGKLDKIKKRFFLEKENGAFTTTLPTDSMNYVKRAVGYFIQAICVIANIDLYARFHRY